MMRTTGFVARLHVVRTLPVAILLALASACSDDGPPNGHGASGGAGGVADGGDESQGSGRGGSNMANEGGVSSGASAAAGESNGGNSGAGGGATPQGGDDASGPDGEAGAAGGAGAPSGPVSRVDAWLAENATFGAELRVALRAVGAEFEQVLASTDESALDADRALFLARQCAYYAKLGAPPWTTADVVAMSQVLGELRAIELDSWDRSEKYVHANEAASGHTFPLIGGSELAASCEQLWSEVAP